MSPVESWKLNNSHNPKFDLDKLWIYVSRKGRWHLFPAVIIHQGLSTIRRKSSLKLRLAIQFGTPVNHLKNRFLIGTPRYEQNVWRPFCLQLSHLRFLSSYRFPAIHSSWDDQRGLLYPLMFIWNSVLFFFSPRKCWREYVELIIISTRENNSVDEEYIFRRDICDDCFMLSAIKKIYFQCLHSMKAILSEKGK